MAGRILPKQLGGAGAADGQQLSWNAAAAAWRPDGGRGVAAVTFASFTSEGVATVTGQAGLPAAPAIVLTVVPGPNDDAYAQDWYPPVARNLVPGVGFDVVLRPAVGTFKGAVNVAWSLS